MGMSCLPVPWHSEHSFDLLTIPVPPQKWHLLPLDESIAMMCLERSSRFSSFTLSSSISQQFSNFGLRSWVCSCRFVQLVCFLLQLTCFVLMLFYQLLSFFFCISAHVYSPIGC
jgi:hypothetical protein